MSLKSGITSPSSRNHSLGAGDSTFEAIVGFNTHKLSSPSSPVQIIRQRYWCKPPQRQPLNIFDDDSNEKYSNINKRRNSIHASLEDLRNESLPAMANVREKYILNDLNMMDSSRSEILNGRGKSLAAHRVYELLMLNAWRKRKEDSVGLTKMVHNLTGELEKHKMLLKVAKSFVKQETRRNENSNAKISILSKKLDEQIRIKESLTEDKETSQLIIAQLEDKLSKEVTLKSNAMNDLIEAKNEKSALETQLEKEREKLLILREEMSSATAKVSELQDIIKHQNDSIFRMNKLNQSQKGMMLTMERQMCEEKKSAKERIDALTEDNTSLTRTVRSLEFEKNELERELRLRREREKEYERRIESLEQDIVLNERKSEQERERALDMLCALLDERRTMELNKLPKGQVIFTLAKLIRSFLNFPKTIISNITNFLSTGKKHHRRF